MGEPGCVEIFPMYLRKALILTDFPTATWTAGICEYRSHNHLGKPLIPIIQCCQLCVNDPVLVIQKQYVHTSEKEDGEKK